MNLLSSIVYVSSATWLLTDDDLEKILEDARLDNSKNQITGVLLYNEGTFFQYIEGPSKNLAEIYEKIKRSRQHRGIIELLSDTLDERIFPDWYMGFFQPSKAELLRLSNKAWWDIATKITKSRKPDGIQLLEFFCRNASRL